MILILSEINLLPLKAAELNLCDKTVINVKAFI